MQDFLTTLKTNWHPMRWVRLGIGLFLGAQGLFASDLLSIFFGVFFLFQAITDTGCGGGRCSV